jgi:hypothetical protein
VQGQSDLRFCVVANSSGESLGAPGLPP